MIRVTTFQQQKVKIDDAEFTIKPLTGSDMVCVTCQSEPGLRLLEVVKRGLVAWDGVVDEDGHFQRFDGNYHGLPAHVLVRLAGEINAITVIGESLEKK